MSQSTNKDSKVYKNVITSEILRPTNNYISIPSKKVASSKRLAPSSSLDERNSTKLPNNHNANGKRSNVVKPKKTVKSTSNVCKPFMKTHVQCEKFGNIKKLTHNSDERKYDPKQERNNVTDNEKKTVLRYYKNENFNFLPDSVQKVSNSFRKESSLKDLDEHLITDKVKFRANLDTVYSDLSETHSTSSEDIYETESLGKLKEFREKNYFECHSVSKTKGKTVLTLPGHKCSYRFYLNDRLFPVPICTDYNNTIRCTECYLPMKFDKKHDTINLQDDENLNGTIQAKVALADNKNQDLTIILPVKETLIIPERRKKNVCQPDNENFYFGVIQLSNHKYSSTNKNWPTDSLALRYQKGYRESSKCEPYRYKKNEDFEFINI